MSLLACLTPLILAVDDITDITLMLSNLSNKHLYWQPIRSVYSRAVMWILEKTTSLY